MTRRLPIALFMAAYLALAPLPSVASAQAAEDAAANEARYRELVHEALAEFERGHWEEARAAFHEAHGLQPSARTHRGLGMVAFERRDYVDAFTHLEAALSDSRKALGGEIRLQTEALLARTRRYVAQLRITTEPEGATVRIDGRSYQAGPNGYARIAIGEHEVVIEADGHETEKRVVEIVAADEHEVHVALHPSASVVLTPERPRPAPAPAPALATAPAVAAHPGVDDAGLLSSWWFWTAVGVVAAGGAATAIVLLSQDDEAPLMEGNVGGVVFTLRSSP